MRASRSSPYRWIQTLFWIPYPGSEIVWAPQGIGRFSSAYFSNVVAYNCCGHTPWQSMWWSTLRTWDLLPRAASSPPATPVSSPRIGHACRIRIIRIIRIFRIIRIGRTLGVKNGSRQPLCYVDSRPNKLAPPIYSDSCTCDCTSLLRG